MAVKGKGVAAPLWAGGTRIQTATRTATSARMTSGSKNATTKATGVARALSNPGAKKRSATATAKLMSKKAKGRGR